MIVKEEEIKRYLELSLSYEDSNIPQALKEWNNEDPIIEQGNYYSIDDFDVYKKPLKMYLENTMDKLILIMWLNIARAALVFSSLRKENKKNQHVFMNLAYLFTSILDNKTNDVEFKKVLEKSILFIDKSMKENNMNKN